MKNKDKTGTFTRKLKEKERVFSKIKDVLQQFLLANGCFEKDVNKFILSFGKDNVKQKKFLLSRKDTCLYLNINLEKNFRRKDIIEVSTADKNKYNIYLFISQNKDFTHKKFKGISGKKNSEFHFFDISFFKINPLNHYLQPTCIVLRQSEKDEELEELFEKYGADRIPVVFNDDPIVRFYLAIDGDVIKYIRMSHYGSSVMYRIVAPRSIFN